jgi:uncharacterized protein (TIGR02271 family)
MTRRSLTAIYDTQAGAEMARDGLVALGIPSDEIIVRGTKEGAARAATDEDRRLWAHLSDLVLPEEDRHTYAEGIRRGGYLLNVQVPDGLEDQALEVLERSGPIDVDERAASWRQSGWIGYQAGASTNSGGVMKGALGAATATTNAAGEQVIPVAEEQVRVGKREVGRGSVRVRSYVVEQPVEEQVELRQERVTIERRLVNRELQPGDAAFVERTIEAVERGEEVVVAKSARVVEEIGIRKDVERETETIRDTVRRQEVEVEDDRGTDRVSTSRNSTREAID